MHVEDRKKLTFMSGFLVILLAGLAFLPYFIAPTPSADIKTAPVDMALLPKPTAAQ